MLGKLIKYDMKTLTRLLLLIHIPMVFLALFARFAGIERIYDLGRPDLPAILTLVLCAIYWSFISLFTQAYTAVYTYRNLFMQEGYLTMTLPVKAGAHVWSKFISGTLWILIDSVFLYGSLLIVGLVPRLLADIRETMPELLSLFRLSGTNSLGGGLCVMTLVSAFGNMALILGCLMFGHCFSKHRILVSILSFFGVITVQQLIGGAVAAGASLKNMRYFHATGRDLPMEAAMTSYRAMFLVFIIMYMILCIVCFTFSCYVLKKRINLE